MPTLVAKGPGAVCYTLKMRGGSDTYIKRDGTIGTAGKGALIQVDKSATLGCAQDQTLFAPLHEVSPPLGASYYKGCGERNGIERQIVGMKYWNGSEVCDTLTSRNAGGAQRMPDKQNFNAVVDEVEYVARRLTPTECARLQGFPDDWCADVPHSDSAEYKLWGNGIALPCLLPMMKAMAMILKEEE